MPLGCFLEGSFGGQAAEGGGGWAGDGLGQIEEGGVLFAAEILRTEEFLEADDLRATGGGLGDAPFGFGEVFVGVEEQAIWTRPMRNLAGCTFLFWQSGVGLCIGVRGWA
ncbi:MAG: hypothetical protein ABSG65_35180 [Bryobacteraceae bacterium]|jgi:hypothetical protein